MKHVYMALASAFLFIWAMILAIRVENASAQRLKHALPPLTYPPLDGVGVTSPCRPNVGAAGELYRRLLPFKTKPPDYSPVYGYQPRDFTKMVYDWGLPYSSIDRTLPSSLVIHLSMLAGLDLVRTESVDYANVQASLEEKAASRQLVSQGYVLKTVNSQVELVNLHSSFLHLSSIYGRSVAESNKTRTFMNGMLKVETDGFVKSKPVVNDKNSRPFPGILSYLCGTYVPIFDAADVRVNMNSAIQTIFQLFYQEHNKRAKEIKKKFPCATDQELFDEARRWTIAIWQNIYFNEVLPIILHSPLPEYTGYKATADPRPSIFDAFIALRWGEAVTPEFQRVVKLDPNSGKASLPMDECPLYSLSNLETCLKKNSLAEIILGLSATQGGNGNVVFSRASTILDDRGYDYYCEVYWVLRFDNFASIIERGRVMGLPDYNSYREYFNLSTYSSIDSLPWPAEYKAGIKSKLTLKVSIIDSAIGAFLESRPKGKLFGPLINAALTRLFTAVRDADRFYFESEGSRFTCAEREEIKATTFSALVRRHSNYTFVIPDDLLSREMNAASFIHTPRNLNCHGVFRCY